MNRTRVAVSIASFEVLVFSSLIVMVWSILSMSFGRYVAGLSPVSIMLFPPHFICGALMLHIIRAISPWRKIQERLLFSSA